MAELYWLFFTVFRTIFGIFVNLPFVDIMSLSVSTLLLRSCVGVWTAKNLDKCKRPKKTLILYEFEACPYCRKVREVLSVLDLDCIIYPCPRTTFAAYGVANEQSRFRLTAVKIGGKAQFPLLIDENRLNDKNEPTHMYESDAICEYLIQMYGDQCELPWSYTLSRIFMKSRLSLAVFCRPLDQHGMKSIRNTNVTSARKDTTETSSSPSSSTGKEDPKLPKKMLELFSSEASPFSKRVREILCSLEIPYLLRNAAHGSVKRAEFKKRFYDQYISETRKKLGLIQIPLLFDPNVDGGKVVLESLDIVEYLKKNYN